MNIYCIERFISLYIFSTGLYGAPRVLQSIADEKVVPGVKYLARGFGANKTPVYAICVVGLVSLAFILIGSMNVISPVITCNFLFVYAFVDYSYFALAMSYDINMMSGKYHNRCKVMTTTRKQLTSSTTDEPHTDDNIQQSANNNTSNNTTASHDDVVLTSSDNDDIQVMPQQKATDDEQQKQRHDYGAVDDDDAEVVDDILSQPASWYSFACNRWCSLFGCVLCITIMFLINWIAALANILVYMIIYLYTQISSPGAHPGVAASFVLTKWLTQITKTVLRKFGCMKNYDVPEEYVVLLNNAPGYSITQTQVTFENQDFILRDRYHQSLDGEYDYISLISQPKPAAAITKFPSIDEE